MRMNMEKCPRYNSTFCRSFSRHDVAGLVCGQKCRDKSRQLSTIARHLFLESRPTEFAVGKLKPPTITWRQDDPFFQTFLERGLLFNIAVGHGLCFICCNSTNDKSESWCRVVYGSSLNTFAWPKNLSTFL